MKAMILSTFKLICIFCVSAAVSDKLVAVVMVQAFVR